MASWGWVIVTSANKSVLLAGKLSVARLNRTCRCLAGLCLSEDPFSWFSSTGNKWKLRHACRIVTLRQIDSWEWNSVSSWRDLLQLGAFFRVIKVWFAGNPGVGVPCIRLIHGVGRLGYCLFRAKPLSSSFTDRFSYFLLPSIGSNTHSLFRSTRTGAYYHMEWRLPFWTRPLARSDRNFWLAGSNCQSSITD